MRRGDVVQFKRGSLNFEATILRVTRRGDEVQYTCIGARLPVMFTTSPCHVRLKRTWGDA